MSSSRMDHVGDKSGAELVRLARLYEFPDFVKQAEMGGRDFIDTGVENAAYADVPRRQFPCHTKVSTFLSALYYAEKQAEFHPKERARIERRLDHYARWWRIKAAVDRVRTRHTELYKAAEAAIPDSAFAYVWVGDNGHKDRRLPIRNAMEVKAATDWLAQYRDSLTFTDRHAIARRLVEKAAQYGAALGDQREFLEKQAGLGVCDPAEVTAMIRNRATLATNPGLRIKFAEMADVIEKTPRMALQPSMLIKLAETVDQLDRTLGLVGKYAPGLDRPEDVIFKATFSKVAADLATKVETQSGKVYDREQFSKLALDDVRALFGDEFANRVGTRMGDVDPEKMAEEVTTLPRPDATMLDGLMSENGVSPLLTKSAAARHGPSKAEWAAWADAYRTV